MLTIKKQGRPHNVSLVKAYEKYKRDRGFLEKKLNQDDICTVIDSIIKHIEDLGIK